MTVGGMGFIPERLLMMMMMITYYILLLISYTVLHYFNFNLYYIQYCI